MRADDVAPTGLDFRNRGAGRILRLFNPMARWMIRRGIPTGGPNVLLTVQGRRSGRPRTVPIAMLEFEGGWFVQACYGEHGWVDNLRVAGEGFVTRPGSRPVPVRATELGPEEAGDVLRRALAPFRRSRLFRALLGPRARGPAGIMWGFRIRVDDSLEEYVASVQRHPVFELHQMSSGQTAGSRTARSF